MQNIIKALHLSPLKTITLLILVGIVFFFSTAFRNDISTNITLPPTDSTAIAKDKMAEESKAAFLKAYSVFMHPRCMNCHPKGDQPLQGDDSHTHLQNVWRGADGKGVYAMKCKNCHQDANIDGLGTPPGNPHWQMPPADKPMTFEGKSPKQLALHFKDNQFTGFKTLNDMIKHVDEESLVLSSFNPPAGVSKIPMSHEEFVDAVKEWIAKGAAVPDK